MVVVIGSPCCNDACCNDACCNDDCCKPGLDPFHIPPGFLEAEGGGEDS